MSVSWLLRCRPSDFFDVIDVADGINDESTAPPMSRQEYKMHFIIIVDRSKEIRMSSKIVDISICACDVSMFSNIYRLPRVLLKPLRYTQEDYYYYYDGIKTQRRRAWCTTSKLTMNPRVDRRSNARFQYVADRSLIQAQRVRTQLTCEEHLNHLFSACHLSSYPFAFVSALIVLSRNM